MYVNRWFVAAGCLVLSPLALAGVSKHVGKGETWLVTAAESAQHYEYLQLDDGSKVNFAAGVDHWNVKVDRAVIGQQVVVDARGVKGRDAMKPNDSARLQDCAQPSAGASGLPGTDGAAGISVDMQIGIDALGSMQLLTNGGDGGAGSSGGNGQDADQGGHCRQTQEGGAGGVGGAGGRGGDAGNVSITYWRVTGTETATIPRQINVVADGGKGGNGGAGGAGGQGSPGHFVNKHSLGGNMTWEAGGKPGAAGEAGKPGETGRAGRVLLVPALAGISSPAVSTVHSSDPAQQQEIDLLKQQLQMMQKRLDAIEKKK